MVEFTCERCGLSKPYGDVRLVEHGTDDLSLCKRCFKRITREVADA